MYFDSYTIMLILPAFVLSIVAQIMVKTAFSKYSKIACRRGITGAAAAKIILERNGIYDVTIEPVEGSLTDHYDPRSKVLRLSEDVYSSTSLAALGVSAHEVGHALQHQVGYGPLSLRTGLVPAANIGSQGGPILAMIGMFMGSGFFLNLGIILFSVAVVFYLITLPVEFNASSRAMNMLTTLGILEEDELKPAKRVLQAAAMTYVASALMAILQLVRLLLISRGSSSRDD